MLKKARLTVIAILLMGAASCSTLDKKDNSSFQVVEVNTLQTAKQKGDLPLTNSIEQPSPSSVKQEEVFTSPSPVTDLKADSGKNDSAAESYNANARTEANAAAKSVQAGSRVYVSDLVDPFSVYTYTDMCRDLKKLSGAYPEILKVRSIGKSVGARDIHLVELGNGKKKVFLNGAHHAREYITSTFLMKMIDEYACAYENNLTLGKYNVKALLGKVTLCIVPMVNPDGVTLAQLGTSYFKSAGELQRMKLYNAPQGFRSWKANLNGVDLNRNYPVNWDKRVTPVNVPASAEYKGPSAASEPETRAVMEYLEGNGDFSSFIAYHTQGEVLYWGDHLHKEMNERYQPLVKRLSELTGYRYIDPNAGSGDYGAGFTEWTRKMFGRLSVTVELCPHISDEPYPDSRFDDIWSKAGLTGLFFADEA